MKKFLVKQKCELSSAVFVHIQKTAGSSIVNIAQGYYGKSLISYLDYDGRRPEEFQDVAFVSGHFGYEFARPLMSDRYSFTFLRDPVERVLSLYYFFKKMDSNEFEMYSLAQGLNLEEFIKLSLKNNHLRTVVCNHQAWQLAHGYGHGTDRNYFTFEEQEMQDLAMSHLEKFSYVGFTETFEADRNIILNRLGVPIPKKDIVVNAGGNRPSIQDLPDSIVDLLGKVTRLDQELYDYAWSSRYS